MGATLDTPARSRSGVCPLCHEECRSPTILRCRHRFCEGCIGELWSGSQTGPYYCPECKQEYGRLGDAVWDTGSSLPSASRFSSGWREKFSSRASNSSLLGKRISQQQAGGRRLGPTLAPSGTAMSDGFSYDEGESPPRKKAHSTLGINSSSSAFAPMNHGSTRRLSTDNNPLLQEGTSTTVWSFSQDSEVIQVNEDHESPESDDSSVEEVQVACDVPSERQSPGKTQGASPKTSTTPGQKSPRATTPAVDIPASTRSPSISGSSPATSSPRRLSPAANQSPLQKKPLSTRDATQPAAFARPDPAGASSRGFVLCHYCLITDQRPAVKTCLQCGASMCAEHLRTHLESPVFQGHPLVPAVDDVSPWRCQEHQEMNRIYCRQCGVCVCTVCTVIGSHHGHACISIKEAEKELRGKLKEEMKKLQEHEQAVMTRTAELLEKKQVFQEVLNQAKANVQNQYQAMRDALELEEQQALLCVSKEEASSLGGVEDQLDFLQTTLNTIQHSVDTLASLADATGALRAQDQAFIMEYNKVTNRISGISNPVENLEALQEVDRARLDCLRVWTERRLDTVVISKPHRDPFRLMYGVTPVLDLDTAHPKLLLSMDNRRVSFSETAQAYPESEARFSSFPQVLASRALCGGRWYWEVEVTADEGRWKVGVCDGQIGRKGQKDSSRMGFNSLSWCLLSEGKGKVEVLHDKTTTAVCSDVPSRVGVLLDFEEGSLSFFSVADEGTLTLLYSYQHTFTQPLYPALAVSKTQLTILNLFQGEGGDEGSQE